MTLMDAKFRGGKDGFYCRAVKRLLDLLLSGCALVLLSPLLLALAALVRVKLGSPVIFCQDRPGQGERIFKMYKFRTMTDARDAEGNLLPDEVRLTDFGKKLRATSLDELPELWNIFKGDMSLVGPRPLLVEYLPYYTETERRRHDVRPGLTGLAQVSGRNTVQWDRRFAYDVEYVDSVSFWTDVKILWRTVCKVAAGEDVLPPGAGEEPETNMAEERAAKRREDELTGKVE